MSNIDSSESIIPLMINTLVFITVLTVILIPLFRHIRNKFTRPYLSSAQKSNDLGRDNTSGSGSDMTRNLNEV